MRHGDGKSIAGAYNSVCSTGRRAKDGNNPRAAAVYAVSVYHTLTVQRNGVRIDYWFLS